MPVRLKTRQQAPASGFIFSIPGTKIPKDVSRTFEEMVVKYLALAAKYPQLKLFTERRRAEDFLDEQNALRLLSEKGSNSLVILSAEKIGLKLELNPTQPGGVELLKGWLAGTLPVARSLAGTRASTCAKCPLNKNGHEDSDSVKKLMRIKNDLGLKTKNDPKLKSCEACDCPIGMIVWLNSKRINSSTDLAKFHDKCWLRKEASRNG